MKKFKHVLFIILLPILLLTELSSETLKKNGILDLSDFDLSKQDKPIPLDTYWEFYWKKFYLSSDFYGETKPRPDIYMEVPSTWQNLNNQFFDKQGFATYRLRVFLHDTNPISFYTKGMGTNLRLFINGELAVEVGKPGKTVFESIPNSTPTSFTYFPKTKDLELIVHISNFHYRMSGFWYPLEIGTPKLINRKLHYSYFLEFCLFASMFMMGLYHIGIYSNRRQALEALYFGLFCLIFALRTLVLGEKFLPSYFEGMPWELTLKIEYLSFYLGLPIFMFYYLHLFKQINYPKFIYFIGAMAALFSLFVLFGTSFYYTHSVQAYQLLTLSCIVYILATLLKGSKFNLPGSKLFIFSLLIFSTTIIHDFLYSNQIIIHSIHLAPFGFISFIFLQSYLLSKNFSIAFSTTERLGIELKEKNEALTKLDKLKDDFLANTSHELKTPLNGIIGLSESLLDGAAGKLPEKVAYNLSLIITSGKRLSNLVNDILDFSKMRSNEIKVSKKPVDIYSISNLVLTLSEALIQKKNITLKNSIPQDFPSAIGDENRIQQILYNLVGNAIKFTDSGEVEIRAEVKEDSFMYISISDTGIGIPEDKFEAIFKSFEQIDSSSDRTYGGTGLGLTVTRQLVELHDGKITLESTLGEGSTFTFSLPVSQEKASSKEPQEESILTRLSENPLELAEQITLNKGEFNYKILIVDDEPINLQVLSNHLSLHNYSILQASNGQEALDILSKSPVIPDLILLDVMMPKMTGYEVCKKIRENYNANILPIVLLTAKNQINDLVQGFIHGANDYLTKPFSKDELLTRIKNHLNLSKTSGAYEKFVPQEFIKLINKDSIIDVKLGDHSEKYMSVLFSDIRSFTTLSETMSPRENFNFINSYLKRMSPIIQEHRGFIDKYIGDAIMALYPEETEDAISSAISMQKNLQEYNFHRINSGYKTIEIGIGINTGNLMLGTIGGLNRMEGTVISDAVNLASRVESMTKKYGVGILISEESYKNIKDKSRYDIRAIDKVIMKGKTSAVWIYEVFDADPEEIRFQKLNTLELFQQAVYNYTDNRYNAAYELFTEIKKSASEDKVVDHFLNILKNQFIKS